MSSSNSGSLPIKRISKAADEEMSYIKGRHSGNIKSLKTPWYKMNVATMNGFEWGTINVIAGMSGSGKTSIVSQIEGQLFQMNKDQEFVVLSFNFEMLARRLVGRKISSEFRRPVKELYNAEIEDPGKNVDSIELREIQKYLEQDIKHLPIYYCDHPGTPSQIRDTVLQFSQQPEIKDKKVLVTLDHSILITPSRADHQERNTLSEFSAIMNDVNKRIGSTWIVLSQMNRNIEHKDRRDNDRLHFPQKQDVFGGDSLYQISDMFMITHWPARLGLAHYGPHKWDPDNIYWHFIKTRDGGEFIARMVNDLKNNRIIEPDDGTGNTPVAFTTKNVGDDDVSVSDDKTSDF